MPTIPLIWVVRKYALVGNKNVELSNMGRRPSTKFHYSSHVPGLTLLLVVGVLIVLLVGWWLYKNAVLWDLISIVITLKITLTLITPSLHPYYTLITPFCGAKVNGDCWAPSGS